MTHLDPVIQTNLELDEIDQGIIDLLRIDGRMALTEISRQLNIPGATARYRVQRLLQSKAIQIMVWPNPNTIGMPLMLILFLMIENGRINAVAEELTAMPEVRFVAILAGRFHIAADVYFGNHADLRAFFDKLYQVQGIISYESKLYYGCSRQNTNIKRTIRRPSNQTQQQGSRCWNWRCIALLALVLARAVGAEVFATSSQAIKHQ